MDEEAIRPRPPSLRSCLLVSLALLILVPVAVFGPNVVWVFWEDAKIHKLSEEAGRYGGSANIPPGDIDFWRREIGVTLNLRRGPIDDAGFARLVSMPAFRHVWFINLAGTRITDRSVEKLRNNPILFSLSLSGTAVTDKSFESLATIPRLNTLRMSGTMVSDVGLEILKERRMSTMPLDLDVTDTAVTEEGVQKLFAAHNQWNIIYGPTKNPKITR